MSRKKPYRTALTFWKKWFRKPKQPVVEVIEQLPPQVLKDADVIVTPNEITDRHGTGVLLRRIFGSSPNLLSIRSSNLYGEQSINARALLLAHRQLTRAQSVARVQHALNGNTVRRVICVPYHADDLITALVLKDLFNVPLCTYLMDDNNIFLHGIPDALMNEVLRKSDLRLAISPEIRDEYERKYRLNFWVVPPVVTPAAVCAQPQMPQSELLTSRTGVLVGSLWSRKWLQLLRQTLKAANLQVHWYGNTSSAPWLQVTREELAQDGIIDCGFLPDEADLTRRLREHPFALIVSGTLDERDDRPEMARLSLPSRMPYMMASACMPMVVLGSPQTAAARFGVRFGVGRVSGYEGAELRQVVEELCQPKMQEALRQQAARHGTLFSAQGIDAWLWQSLAKGAAADNRFEQHFRRESEAPKSF